LRPVDRNENSAGDNGGNQKCSFDLFHDNLLPCNPAGADLTAIPLVWFLWPVGRLCGARLNAIGENFANKTDTRIPDRRARRRTGGADSILAITTRSGRSRSFEKKGLPPIATRKRTSRIGSFVPQAVIA
jgi:hypothetical protein